jgi:hypothetical protein
MTPKLLGRVPSSRQNPWMFVECYVPARDVYYPFNQDEWGSLNASASALALAGQYRFETCQLSCSCAGSCIGNVSVPNTSFPVASSNSSLPVASSVTSTKTTTTTTTVSFLNSVVNCTGFATDDRCWYLSDTGASCADTCATHACTYNFSVPPSGDAIPKLLGRVPSSPKNPWMFIECYVPDTDQYYPFNQYEWAVHVHHEDEGGGYYNAYERAIAQSGQFSFASCQLACPCVGACVDVTTTVAAAP